MARRSSKGQAWKLEQGGERAHIPNHKQVVTEQTGSEGRRLFTLKAYSQ